MIDNENRKWLYDKLTKDGYNLGKYEEFDSYMSDDEESRKWVYDTAASRGYDVGKDFDEFTSIMSAPQPEVEQKAPSYAVVDRYKKTEPETSSYSDRPLTEADKAAALATAQEIVDRGQSVVDTTKENLEALQSQKPLDVVEPKTGYNQESGKFETQYETAEGETYKDGFDAAVAQEGEDIAQQMRQRQIQELKGRAEDEIRRIYEQKAAELEGMGFWENLFYQMGRNRAGSVTAAVPGVKDPYAYSEDEQERMRSLSAAQDMLKNAERIYSALRDLRKSEGLFGGGFADWNNVTNFARGVKDTATDMGTWDMGAGELNNAVAMLALKDKLESGEELTYDEMILAEASLLNAEWERIGEKELPNAYQAAQTTVEMLPFMAQMALVPGNGFGGMFAGKVAEKLGREGLKAIAARAAARITGDILTSAALASTAQGMSTAADIIERSNGTLGMDENGRLMFTDGKSLGQSVYEGVTAATIENFTEMALRGTGSFIGGKLASGFERFANPRTIEMLQRASRSSIVQGISRFEQKTKWGGPLEEMLEEEVNIVLNSGFVGDSKLKDLVDWEKQEDIILGVGVFGATVSAMKTVGFAAMDPYYRNQMDAAGAEASRRLGGRWAEVRSAIDNASDQEALAEVLRGYRKDGSLTEEQKRSVLKYGVRRAQWQGYNTGLQIAREEMGEFVGAGFDAFQAGMDMEGAERNAAARRHRDAYIALTSSAEGVGLMNSLQEAIRSNADESVLNDIYESASDAIRPALTEYFASERALQGILYQSEAEAKKNVAQFDAEADAATVRHENGVSLITTATYKGNQVYVVNDNGSTAVILQMGKSVQVSSQELTDKQSHYPNEYKETYRAAVEQSVKDEIDFALNHHEETKMPEVGSVIRTMDQSGEQKGLYVTAVEGDKVKYVPAVYDAATGSEIPQSGVPVQEMTVEESLQLQDMWNEGASAMTEAPVEAEMPKPQEATESAPYVPSVGETFDVVLDGESYRATAYGESPDGRLSVELDRPYEGKTDLVLPEDAIVVPVPSVPGEATPASAQNVQPKQEEQKPQSALDRIPKNEQGELVYEQTDAETAWDAIMEQTEGDAEMAAAVVASTIADKQKALEDAQTAEIPQGTTVQEKIAAQKTHKQNIENAQKELAHWQEIAGVEAKRAEMAAHENNVVSKMQEAETEAVGVSENGREETVGLPVALEYLLEGGKGSIENAGYFLYGIQAAFPHISNETQSVRGTVSSDELGMTPDAWVASNPQALQDIRAMVARVYGEAGVNVFDKLLANSTGFYPREGKAVGLEIESLTPLAEASKARVVDPNAMSEGEKRRRGDMLRDARAVDVQQGVIVATSEMSARKAAEKWWDENVSDTLMYNTEVGEVEINRNSIESSLAHRYGQRKLDAITSLVEGFENAVYLGTLPDSRERGVVDHYFAYPINYNGERCYVFCRAMQDANKNRLYVHEVFVGEKIKKGDTLQTAASKPHGGIALYKDILANVLEVPSTGKVTESSAVAKETAGNISETTENVTSTEQNEAEQTSTPAREGEVSARTATPTEIINEYKEPLRRVARNWGKKLGVKVHVLESLDEVPQQMARDQIVAAESKRQNVPGWYDRETGEVYIYMPHVNSMKDITSTLVHEVVSHHGLKALLGEKGYDRLCDQVYKMLPLSERKKWLKYPGVNGNHRKAADEYIAHLSEGVRNIGTERSVWQKIVAFVRKALRDMGLELEASDRELEDLLRASHANLRKNAKKNGEGKANHVGKGKKIAEKNWILTAYDESAGDNTSAISDANQGKAAPTPANSADKGAKNISFRKAKDANNLVAVHNISEQDLRRVFEMGSLIMPSIAITDVNIGHSGYGEISLLFDKETINPTDRRNKVYGGDAWTPRFPQMVPKLKGSVLRSVREKIYGLLDAATRELYSLSAELHPSNIEDTISRNGIPGYYGKEYMKIAYLLDNGKRFKIPMKEKDYGSMAETIVKLAKEKSLSLIEIKNGGYEFYEKNPEFVAAVQEAKVEQRLGGIPAEQREAVRKMLLENPIRFSVFDTYIYQALSLEYDLEHGGKKQIVDKTALYDTINKRVKTDNADYNKWVDGLFEGVVEKYGIRNKRDWYTSSGNSRTWEQLYDAATPGNILRHMLAENEQGGSGGLWDSNIMGASAETYESIDEIREKGKERLKRIDDKEYREWSESVANRLSEICDEFMPQSQKDEFGGFIDAKIAITNAVAKDKSAKGIYKEMRKEYPKFTMGHAKIVEDVVKEIQNQAIGYFEAKPQRIVPLSEVRKAVVPSNVGSDIVEELEKNGVEVATYRKGNEQARQRAVKKASNDIRFRVSNDNQEIFVSNAQRAVEGIKQEKGTPQQWLAMIEKNGGMKAGEDKWLGLSDWLKGMGKKSVTKQEILDFIGENRIRIEEVVYKEIEEDEAWEEYKGSEEGSRAIIEQFESDAMDYAQRQVHYDDYETEEEYQDAVDRAVREYHEDPWGTYFDAAEREVRRYWEAPEGINSTRLTYTTEGLENKQEIALTVPTIEPWNESDEIHFGDAGGGRAVAWIRFGESTVYKEVKDVQVVDEFHEPFRGVNGRDVYRPVGSFRRGDYVVYGEARTGDMIFVVFINDKQIPVAHATLEDARNAMNEYYREHPRTLRKPLRVLAIDEIQSKRHQDGRERGYKNLKDFTVEKQENGIWHILKNGELVAPVAAWEAQTEEEALKEYAKSLIPSAPFEKNWHELAMKRMMRYAAENGYDKVAWTTGAQQSERYNLSSVVDHISYIENEDGTLDARAYFPNGGYQPIGKTWEEVAENVGKDIAKRMQEGVSEGTEILTWGMGRDGRNIEKEYKTLSRGNFSIGGEGMKGFYDKILPSFVSKYVKKWGAKVGEVELPEVEEAGQKMWSVDITPEMKADVMEGQVMFSVKDGSKNNESPADYDRASGLGLPTRKGAPVANFNAKVNQKSGIKRKLDEVLNLINKKKELSGHEFLFELSKAFSLNKGKKEFKKSEYYAIDDGITLRLSNHYGNTDSFKRNKELSNNYGLVIKLSKNKFKSSPDVDYLEYGYFPDKLTSGRQIQIIEGLKSFLNDGNFTTLPTPDNVNTSGKMEGEYRRYALFERAKEEYGVTNDFGKAGYMLPSAELLDFSYGAEVRSLDHRNISRLYPDVEHSSRWEYVIDFLNEGAIRLVQESGIIEMTQPPTAEQRKKLKEYIRKENGYVIVEINSSNGESQAYKEYDEGTTSDKVLADVDRFFNEGISFRITEEERKQKQLEIIQESNPAEDDYHTWIRSTDDIKSFEEALDAPGYADFKGEDLDPSYTWDMVEEALRSGVITVYSSKPIENGAFVTPSSMEAESYAGNGEVYEATLPLQDIAWIDPTQGQVAKVGGNDIRFSVRRNSGYTERENGQAISRRASYAEEEGSFTKGPFLSKYGVSRKAFPVLEELGIIDGSEWHHTGKGFNKSNFYSWADSAHINEDVDYSNEVPSGSYGDIYQTNKKKIDELVGRYESAQWEYGVARNPWNVSTLEEYVASRTYNNYLTPEELKEKEEKHSRISASEEPSWVRRERHMAVDEEYKNLEVQRVIADKENPLVKEHEEEFGERIRENEAIAEYNRGLKERNAATNGKEKVLLEIAELFGKDAAAKVSFLSERSQREEKRKAQQEAFQAERAEREAEIQRKEKDLDKWVEKKIAEGKASRFTRVKDRPMYSVVTDKEMNGKYGWFKADSKYNGSVYYTGFNFESKRTFDAYQDKEAEIRNLRNELRNREYESERVSFRTAPSFKDGEQLPIQGEKGAYFVEGLTGGYQNADYLLDAFRSKYPEYLAELNEGKTAIVVEPWSKYLGPTTSKKAQAKQDAHRERVAKSVKQAVRDAAEKLHIPVALTTSDKQKGKRAKAKGWYDTKTHEIVIVVDNHSGVHDALATVLHEGVAHYGLRKMFGSNFDNFLDNVFKDADKAVRQRIIDLAEKNGWDFREATEEYLASLAEDADFENAVNQGWFHKIKKFFFHMLSDLGIADAHLFPVGDNELRYILWRSYENLKNPLSMHNVFTTAEDVVMQNRLMVGPYAKEMARIQSLGKVSTSELTEGRGYVAEGVAGNSKNSDLRFRVTPRDRAIARDSYERTVASSGFQMREVLQDSLHGLRRMMEAISGKDFLDISGNENVYFAANRLSSVNAAEQEEFRSRLMQPLFEEISRLTRTEAERIELVDYMMAKHGLERNVVLAERDALEQSSAKGSKISYADALAKNREKDYSGLTTLMQTPDVAGAEQAAQDFVDSYESTHYTDDLWNLINAATDKILDKTYKSGLITRESLDHIRGMFKYYIPLRGWEETRGEDVYAYINSNDGVAGAGKPIKHAKGRTSVADDPIAYIQLMADTAISQGNRNLVKQHLLTFVNNHPSDLVSVSDLWLEKDAVTGEWKPVFPDIDVNDTPEMIEQAVEAFEAQMEQLASQDPDRYKRGKDAKNIPYRLDKNNLKEHQIIVRRLGAPYVLTINGNPRAAQAVNGLTNPDADNSAVMQSIINSGRKINRWRSVLVTTGNIAFIARNLARDTLYTWTTIPIKENARYTGRFYKYWAKNNVVKILSLFHKYLKGNLDMNNKTDRYFKEFMDNGGETGYTSLKDIEGYKKETRSAIKGAKSSVRKATSSVAEGYSTLNRAIENCARFAAYVASRESGRDVARSVYDAKEVSLNFNTKGSGGKFFGAQGQSFAGNAAAFVSGLGRLMYLFWNPSVQALMNFSRLAKRHTGKFLALPLSLFSAGFARALFAGDDDEDDYYNLPEYLRRSHMCFSIGKGKWVTIPLPVELAAIYGMGELAASIVKGKESNDPKELGLKVAGQISQIMPIDLVEGMTTSWTSFVPDAVRPIVEAGINKSWTGLPIYREEAFYSKGRPGWTRAYDSTSPLWVNAAKWLNRATGGDSEGAGLIDLNPAALSYIVSGYLGGPYALAMQGINLASSVFGEREFQMRDVPVVSAFIKESDERAEEKRLNGAYYRIKDIHDVAKRRSRILEGDNEEAIKDLKYGSLEEFDASKESQIMDEFDYYDSIIKDLQEEPESPEIREEVIALKRELMERVREIEESE